MNNNICVNVDSVSKKFPKSSIGIKQFALNLFSKNIYLESNEEWVLNNISFEIEKGTSFFIAGPNGTGKSTLLSLIQGIISPDKGKISTEGKLIAINELGGGFHPDLTGRDNVFVNGKILGNKYSDLKSNFKKIVTFSGIGKSIDNPLRTYSNGMIARLAFSIIVHTKASIILIDEILSVGDNEFRKKCMIHFENFKKKGGTIILVSHDIDQLKNFCDKGIYLTKDFISPVINPKELIKNYLN